MTDLTSLWHAAAPPPPPAASSSSSDSLYKQARAPSPSKSPLHRVLRSISPSPNNGMPRSRTQSLQFDTHSRGDDLPADTHSPEPPKPQRRQQTVDGVGGGEHHGGYESRQRTMSYTSGDSYAPWGSSGAQYGQQPPSAHGMMPSSSSSSLHGQWLLHQQQRQYPQQQQPQQFYQQHQPHQVYHQQRPQHQQQPMYHQQQHPPPSPPVHDARMSSPTAYSHPQSPTHYAHGHAQAQAHAHAPSSSSHPASPTHPSSTPPVSRSAYYNTVGHAPVAPPQPQPQPQSPASSSPARSRSPLPMPMMPQQQQQQQQQQYQTAPVSPAAAPTSAFEAWRNAQYHQERPASTPVMGPTSPAPPSMAVPFPPSAAPSVSPNPNTPPPSIQRSAAGSATGTMRRALPRPPGAAPSGAVPVVQTPTPPGAVPTVQLPTLPTHAPTSQTQTSTPPPTQTPTSPPPPSSHTSSPSTSSTLSRTDSVRMAAEELMSRGVPRRGGGARSLRSGRSGLFGTVSKSSSPLANGGNGNGHDAASTAFRTSQSEPVDVARGGGGGDDNGDDLARRFATTAKIDEGEEHGGEHSDGDRNASTVDSSVGAGQPSTDSTSAALDGGLSHAHPPPTRPSSRGPRDDVMQGERTTQTMPPPSSSRPATFASAQAEAKRERETQQQHRRQQSARAEAPSPPTPTSTSATIALSPARDIPKVFSPPPNAAPPVPSIIFDDAPVGNGVPTISVSNADAQGAPAISVNDHSTGPSINVSGPDDHSSSGPSINISGPDDDDNAASSGPMISVSGPEGDDEGAPSISVSGPDATPHAQGIPPSVSLSHTADHVPATPQRASATTSQSIEQQQKANGHVNGGGGHHHHPHSHTHPHTHTHGAPRPAATPARTPQGASSVAGAVCGGCSKYIAGRVVQAIDQCFHPDCFSCNHCGELLEHVAFYEHQGKAYCHFDYHELFSLRCFHCRTPIVDERFIQISDPDLVAGKGANSGGSSAPDSSSPSLGPTAPVRYYHDLHFFCANCGDPFMDPKRATSTAGSQRGQIQVDDQGRVISGSKAFVVWKGYPYCEGCHHNLHKARCKSCTKPILHDVITALKGKWHPECFVCTGCKRPYPDERVYVDSKGNGYDEECYKVWLRGQL